MLQEDVRPLLEGFALLMVEHVFRLEGLIDRQIDRIVRIGDAARSVAHVFAVLFVYDVFGGDHVPSFVVPSEPLFPLQGCGDSFVVRLAETGRPMAS